MPCSLLIYFSDPFWVAVVEREEGGSLAVARHVFGAEPTGAEALAWALTGYRRLSFFRHARPENLETKPRARSPKRAQREARRAAEQEGPSTRSQEAMRLDLEARKTERTQTSRAQREAEELRRRAIKDEKRRQKHRGH